MPGKDGYELVGEYEGEVPDGRVEEQKYLGFVLSDKGITL